MKFKSEYFENADELVQAKDDALSAQKDRRERLDIIRKFTNMMNTMTDEEAEEAGITEITNHGQTYKQMLQNEVQYSSMVTGTNGLVEIIVDTDNAEKDLVTGLRMSEAINRGAIHFKGKFANLWRKVSGEIVIAGGGPVTQNERYGWLPQLRTDMFFPLETPLDAEGVTFAFDPKNLSVADLSQLLAAVEGEETSFIEKRSIEGLMDLIKEQIAKRTRQTSHEEETKKSIRAYQTEMRKVTLPAWWYYEVKHPDKSEPYVSATLFVDGSIAIESRDIKNNVTSRERLDTKDSSAQIIAHIEKAFEYAFDWLHLVCVDSEIGGVKNLDTLRGVAEMSYPSGVDMEELLNAIIEGEKIKARPKVRVLDGANPDEIAAWDMVKDVFVPKGLEEMPFKNVTNGLQLPLMLLSQNAAGLATSPVSNTAQGGELRAQALERQQSNSLVQANRVSEAANHLDSVLETVIHRILTSDAKPGTEGYNEVMWIRAYLERYGIDYKALAARKYGRFEYIRVRAKRSIGNGDRREQIDTADWLMSNLPNYEPISRPSVIHKATALRTQDPDLADYLVKPPKALINAQKITAENEYDTIRRRAPLGQVLPIAQDDIHQDHIPIHLLDMQAHVASHSIRPWDKLDVLIFTGATEHTGEHLKTLLSNPATHGEGLAFVQDFQNIAQSAQRIVQEVEQAEGGSDMNQLTPKERADLELKWAQMELEGRKFGLKVADTQKLWENREARAAISQRSQFTNEINNHRRLQLDKERADAQAEAQKKQTTTA